MIATLAEDWLMNMHKKSWTNICGLFYILAKLPLTKRETELDYYNQRGNVRVVSRVAERLKT